MTLWTETEFEVGDRDITNLVMSLVPGVTVSGRLVFSDAGAGPVSAARCDTGGCRRSPALS
jgi:hypothetical protein